MADPLHPLLTRIPSDGAAGTSWSKAPESRDSKEDILCRLLSLWIAFTMVALLPRNLYLLSSLQHFYLHSNTAVWIWGKFACLNLFPHFQREITLILCVVKTKWLYDCCIHKGPPIKSSFYSGSWWERLRVTHEFRSTCWIGEFMRYSCCSLVGISLGKLLDGRWS